MATQPIERSCAMLGLLGDIWAIEPRKFGQLADAARSSGGMPDPPKGRGMFYAQGGSAGGTQSKIALLNLSGVIEQRQTFMGELFGGTSTEAFGAAFATAIADPQVKAVAINVDSPGGTVEGVPELSDQIYRARTEGKPIVAVANSLMASAAYWIGSAAHRLYIAPSGSAGSIGVMAVHVDVSEALAKFGIKESIIQSVPFKSEFASSKPLEDDARDRLQAEVDDLHRDFVSDVARNRGIDTKAVNSDFGKGRVFRSREAISSGMVDRVATLPEVLTKLASGRIHIGRASAEDDWDAKPRADHRADILRRRALARRQGVDSLAAAGKN